MSIRRLVLAALTAIALAGCTSSPSTTAPAPVPTTAAAPAPAHAPAVPPVTASGCAASYQQLNNVDSVVNITTVLTNNTDADLTVGGFTVAFLNSSGTQIGALTGVAPDSPGNQGGASEVIGPHMRADVMGVSDTINLTGQWASTCTVLSIVSQPGDGP